MTCSTTHIPSLAAGRLFSPGTPVSFANKIYHHDSWTIVESGVIHHCLNPPLQLTFSKRLVLLKFMKEFVLTGLLYYFCLFFSICIVIFFYCQCTTDSPEYMSEDIQSKSRHMQRIPDCHNKQLLYCVTLLILEQNDISILFKGNSKLNRKYVNCGFFQLMKVFSIT